MTDPVKQAVRLRDDFPFFAWNCLKIRAKNGSILPFALNRAQRYVHDAIELQKAQTGIVRAIILKGRQQGMSTYVEGRLYWLTAMRQGKTAFILTHEDKATQNIFGMTRRYHDLMPDAIRPATAASNANEIAFSGNQSRYAVGTAGSRGVGRSFTVQYFHGSEAGFWPNAEDHFAGLGQAVPNEPGTEIILESTGNGVGNVFYSLWQDAVRGKSWYIPIFVPWFWQEEYRQDPRSEFVMDSAEAEYAAKYGLDVRQMAWRRQKIIDDFRGDVSLFDQEYPATAALAFRPATESSLIPMDMVMRAQGRIVSDESNAPLIFGVDPAEYGEDATAIVVRKGRKVISVERFYKRGPMDVAGIVAIRADAQKPRAINVDCTGVGSGVADRLIELGYPVNRVHFGAKAIDSEQYGIRRDEMWGEMRTWFEDEPSSLPDDEVLLSDLTGPSYSYDSSRRLKLESKESMKKRRLDSPDSGDALALTFAVRIAPKSEKPSVARKFNWRVGV